MIEAWPPSPLAPPPEPRTQPEVPARLRRHRGPRRGPRRLRDIALVSTTHSARRSDGCLDLGSAHALPDNSAAPRRSLTTTDDRPCRSVGAAADLTFRPL